MARKTEKTKIGAFEYEMKQLGAYKGQEVVTRLAPLFGLIVSKAQKDPAGAIADALGMIKPEDVRFLSDTFAEVTIVKDAKGVPCPLSPIFDEHFAGEYKAMMQWLGFGLSSNF